MNVTNSKLKTYRRCPRQFYYKHGMKLAPNTAAQPLKRGLWLHRLLEVKYEGNSWRQCLKHELGKEWKKLFDEEKEYYGNLPDVCERIMASYDYQWREEDSTLEPVATELEITIDLGGGHTLTLRADMLVQDEWGLWLWEHKSHNKRPRHDYRFLDPQTSLYVEAVNREDWVRDQFGEVTGVCWNYLPGKPPTQPQLTKTGRIARIATLSTDLYTFVTTVRSLGLNPHDYPDTIARLRKGGDNFFVRDRVPKAPQVVKRIVHEAVVTANQIQKDKTWTRTVERSCEFSCPFIDLCVTDLYGGNTKPILKQKFHVRELNEYYADAILENLG